jgi:hypothetical protein
VVKTIPSLFRGLIAFTSVQNQRYKMENSKRRAVHVVKKQDPIAPDPSMVPASPASDRSIAAAVDNWIAERNCNRDAALIFSNVSIANWRTLPDTRTK